MQKFIKSKVHKVESLNYMKKSIIFLSIILLLCPVFARAGDSEIKFEDFTKAGGAKDLLGKTLEGTDYETKKVKSNSLIELGGLIVLSVTSLLGVFFVILAIYAGYLWMTASGNEEQVTKAKGLIINSVIGIVIVFSAFAISWFVLDKVSSKTITNINNEP